MAVHQDPRDIKPEDFQDQYPFGERCSNPRGHSAHVWCVAAIPTYFVFPVVDEPSGPKVISLSCNGHTRCGKPGEVYSQGEPFDTLCYLTQDHDDLCRDEIWGPFRPMS